MASSRLDVVTRPGGEIGLGDVTCGNAEHGQYAADIVSNEFKPIANQKKFNGYERGTFVAIDERMVAGDAKPVGRRKIAGVWIFIVRKIFRSRNGGRKSVGVTDTRQSTVFGQLLGMHCQQNRLLDPNPCSAAASHFASSRKTARRFFMMARAFSICASNSGS